MAKPEQQYQIVSMTQLRPATWNPRLVTAEAFQQLFASIKADPGMLEDRPILAQEDGTIYGGNQRYRAVAQLYAEQWISPWGYGLIPARITNVDDATAKARSVRDNNNAGDWQELELAELLLELAGTDTAVLPTLGFSDTDLQNILASCGVTEAVDPFTGRIRSPENMGEAPESQGEPEIGSQRAQRRSAGGYGLIVWVETVAQREDLRHMLTPMGYETEDTE